MNIRKNWTSAGNEISINIEVGNRGKFTGTVTNHLGTFEISRIAIVKGRKVAPIIYKGKPAYQTLPSNVYDEIDSALRKNFEMTEVEILEGKIEVAKREYHKALNIGPAQANPWLDEWNELSAQLQSVQ